MIAAEVLLWHLLDTLGSRERKKKNREVRACLLLCFSRASLALLDRRYFSAIIIRVCLPYVSSNKNKCQKSYYFPWKEACLGVRARGFLGWVIPHGCQLQGRLLLLQLRARVSRARGEAEQGEADWGKGERAPVANETYRFGLRENKFSFAGA